MSMEIVKHMSVIMTIAGVMALPLTANASIGNPSFGGVKKDVSSSLNKEELNERILSKTNVDFSTNNWASYIQREMHTTNINPFWYSLSNGFVENISSKDEADKYIKSNQRFESFTLEKASIQDIKDTFEKVDKKYGKDIIATHLTTDVGIISLTTAFDPTGQNIANLNNYYTTAVAKRGSEIGKDMLAREIVKAGKMVKHTPKQREQFLRQAKLLAAASIDHELAGYNEPGTVKFRTPELTAVARVTICGYLKVNGFMKHIDQCDGSRPLTMNDYIKSGLDPNLFKRYNGVRLADAAFQKYTFKQNYNGTPPNPTRIRVKHTQG